MDVVPEKTDSFPLSPAQQKVVQELQDKWKKAGISAPFGTPSAELLACYARSKKKTDQSWEALLLYTNWSNMLDFEHIPWDRIETALRQGFLVAPCGPFSAVKENGAQLVFINTVPYKPQKLGVRTLIATIWMVLHFYLFCGPNAFANGVSMCGDMSEIGWDKFYPSVQRNVMDAMQSVLPIRPQGSIIVDPPWVFDAIYAIMRPFLSDKLKDRMRIITKKEASQYVDNDQLPSFFGGTLDEASHLEEWIATYKKYYEGTFQPMMSVKPSKLAEPVDIDLWEPKPKKVHKRDQIKDNPKDRKSVV